MAEFSDLKGQTIWRIEGLEVDSGEVTFHMHDGKKYIMNHHQD